MALAGFGGSFLALHKGVFFTCLASVGGRFLLEGAAFASDTQLDIVVPGSFKAFIDLMRHNSYYMPEPSSTNFSYHSVLQLGMDTPVIMDPTTQGDYNVFWSTAGKKAYTNNCS